MNISPSRHSVRRLAIGLALLSLLSLVVTTWIFFTVRREQAIVSQITKHLPASDLVVAQELSGELNLQRSLLFLLVLNVVATAVALVFVVRAYLSSEQSLADVKVLSSDILASMDAGVITTDKNGVLTSINPSGQAIVDLPDDDHAAVSSSGFNRPSSITDLGDEHALLAGDPTEGLQIPPRPCPDQKHAFPVAMGNHARKALLGDQPHTEPPFPLRYRPRSGPYSGSFPGSPSLRSGEINPPGDRRDHLRPPHPASGRLASRRAASARRCR